MSVVLNDALEGSLERRSQRRRDPCSGRFELSSIDARAGKVRPIESLRELPERGITSIPDILDDLGNRVGDSRSRVGRRRQEGCDVKTASAQINGLQHPLIVPPTHRASISELAAGAALGDDRRVDDAVELSSLLASLEDISRRVSALVESNVTLDGVDAELISLERSISASLRRLRRATRSAEKRGGSALS